MTETISQALRGEEDYEPLDVVYTNPFSSMEEMQYSLRSLANLDHRDVTILGYDVPWLRGVTFVPTRVADADTGYAWWRALRACMEMDNDLTDYVILMQDDMFVMKHVRRVPVLASGRFPSTPNASKAKQFLREQGVDSPVNFEGHVPFPVNRQAFGHVMDAMEEAGIYNFKKSIYGNLCGVEADNAWFPNAKVHGQHMPKWADRKAFLSSTPTSWAAELGDFVKAQFPEPGCYEAKLKSPSTKKEKSDA